ncbi:hypothetical protein CBR_g41064 [Chara braunii]|uniref:Uncharacterized protein n=1 Tax=Chara braunii TaxID=69332 RepID=A0A388LV15_CHABU|nr:hypothetical protein CBR_g41064 [Chara braunii]|eukprot:GBG86160.1 hypothetical protein CBR_g41064 [Chara braunii]
MAMRNVTTVQQESLSLQFTPSQGGNPIIRVGDAFVVDPDLHNNITKSVAVEGIDQVLFPPSVAATLTRAVAPVSSLPVPAGMPPAQPSIPAMPMAAQPSVPVMPMAAQPSVPVMPMAAQPSVPGMPMAAQPSLPGMPITAQASFPPTQMPAQPSFSAAPTFGNSVFPQPSIPPASTDVGAVPRGGMGVEGPVAEEGMETAEASASASSPLTGGSATAAERNLPMLLFTVLLALCFFYLGPETSALFPLS